MVATTPTAEMGGGDTTIAQQTPTAPTSTRMLVAAEAVGNHPAMAVAVEAIRREIDGSPLIANGLTTAWSLAVILAGIAGCRVKTTTDRAGMGRARVLITVALAA